MNLRYGSKNLFKEMVFMPVTFKDLTKSGGPLSSESELKKYVESMEYSAPFKGTESLDIVMKLAKNEAWSNLFQEMSENPNGNKVAMIRKHIAVTGSRKELADALMKAVGKSTIEACKAEVKRLERADNLIEIGMDLHGWNSNIADSDYAELDALLDTVAYVALAAAELEGLGIVDDFKASKK